MLFPLHYMALKQKCQSMFSLSFSMKPFPLLMSISRRLRLILHSLLQASILLMSISRLRRLLLHSLLQVSFKVI